MVDRSGYVAGLRDLANRLERFEDCPLPAHGRHLSIGIFTHNPSDWALAVEAMPDGEVKFTDYGTVGYTVSLHGLMVRIESDAVRGYEKVVTRDDSDAYLSAIGYNEVGSDV